MEDRIWEKYEYISITRILDTQFKKNLLYIQQQFGLNLVLCDCYFHIINFTNSTEYVVIVCHHTHIYGTYIHILDIYFMHFYMDFFILWVCVQLFPLCNKKKFSWDCNAFNSSSKTVENLYFLKIKRKPRKWFLFWKNLSAWNINEMLLRLKVFWLFFLFQNIIWCAIMLKWKNLFMNFGFLTTWMHSYYLVALF